MCSGLPHPGAPLGVKGIARGAWAIDIAPGRLNCEARAINLGYTPRGLGWLTGWGGPAGRLHASLVAALWVGGTPALNQMVIRGGEMSDDSSGQASATPCGAAANRLLSSGACGGGSHAASWPGPQWTGAYKLAEGSLPLNDEDD